MSAKILRWPRHKWAHCDECEGCFVCRGGLAVCVVCGGAALTALPTDCPGEPMPNCVADDVKAGAVDYRARTGWTLLVRDGEEYPRWPGPVVGA